MASTTAAVPVDPDTQVTVKVYFQEGIRRFRLPLRDLGPSVLPGKLRQSLAVPENSNLKLERYSDSAASWVVLDSTILSVYKQLYRAAKAKLKLRLRATVLTDESVKETPPAYASQVSVVSPAPFTPVMDVPVKTTTSEVKQPSDINQVVADAVKMYMSSTEHENNLKEKVREEVERQSRAPSVVTVEDEQATPVPAAVCGSTSNKMNVTYMVCCNNCDTSIDGVHYHCSTCDGGDYDLCQKCLDKGIHCSVDHWLIKRHLHNGQFVSSTTETVSKKQSPASTPAPVPVSRPQSLPLPMATRTCNCCIASLPEECFVTCLVCPDYDICLPCHITKKHGHHPMHGFMPANQDTPLDAVGTALLGPGRGVKHNAICDGCNTTIYGVRYKCLDCPDWDFCTQCHKKGDHPGHRFVPLYDTIALPSHISSLSKSWHYGVYCDGPLCTGSGFIHGDRYKCTVCNDADFCAACEAHPKNKHNRTHPLIKMKTPIRHISCVTQENDSDRLMGDRNAYVKTEVTEKTVKESSNAATQVQTVADIEPTVEEAPKDEVAEPLEAEFFSDTIDDGTVMQPGHSFSQTWIMRNSGKTAWPAGISVKFVGGDQMFGTLSADQASAFTTTQIVEAGEFAAFSVNLVVPEVSKRRVISYWRLTDRDGNRFGHKIWCDVMVEAKEEPIVESKAQESKSPATLAESVSSSSSDMVFPKLDKESVILSPEAAASTDTVVADPSIEDLVPSPMHSPSWTMSEEEGHISDVHTSEDDVDSLMLDEEDYEVLETSDDDGYNKVI